MTESRLSTRVCSLSSLSAEDAGVWDRIHLKSPESSAFLSRHFANSVAKAGREVKVTVISRDGQAVAFLPFQYASYLFRLLKAGERVGGHMSDYFGIIAAQNFSTDPNIILNQCKLSSLEFSHLDESQKKYGLVGRKESVGVRYIINGNSDIYWDQIKQRDKKFHAHTFRQERRIERELGPLRLEFNVETDERHKVLDELINLKRQQYKKTGVKDVFAKPWTRALLHDLAEQEHDGCTGVLSRLLAGDTPVSLHFGIQSNQCLHIWFPCYYEQANRYSPGRLMLKALIDQGSKYDVQYLDDGEASENQQQKRMMSTHSHKYYSDIWTQPGATASLVQIYNTLDWRLKKLKRRLNASLFKT